MKPHRLNLLSALAALAGSLVWLALGQFLAGAVWFAASLVWVWMALARYRDPDRTPNPAGTLVRRLSRLLLWS